MTVWVCDGSGFRFRLAENVVDHLRQHRQLRWRDTEAGGPLYSRAPGRDCEVSEASGPFLKDRRMRHGYVPHRPSVQTDIDQKHVLGLHFIGTWHTHPSAKPTASHLDVVSMLNLYRESAHDLDAFLMVIVGTDANPSTWELSLHGEFGNGHVRQGGVIFRMA